MKQQIEILKKIQELSLTRAECVARKDAGHADAITQEIEALAAKLDPRMRALYERLSATKPLFMAAMHNGNCSGCGMLVPVAAAKMVRLAEHPVTCTTCGRLLYDNVGTVASSREKVEATAEEISKVKGLARFSCEALMFPDLKAKTPQEAITTLADALAANGYVTNGEELARLALEREALLSTRMGEGAAVPHVRGVEGGSLAFALGISKKGIVWDDSGERVNFVVLSAIPSAGSAFFLKLMNDLMGAFRRKLSRAALLDAADAATLWQSLDKATRRVIH